LNLHAVTAVDANGRESRISMVPDRSLTTSLLIAFVVVNLLGSGDADASRLIDVSVLFVLLWLVYAVLRSTLVGITLWRLRFTPLDARFSDVESLIARVGVELGLTRRLVVYRAGGDGHIGARVVHRVRQPMLVVSDGLIRLARSHSMEADAVIRHELAHICNRDYRFYVVLTLLCLTFTERAVFLPFAYGFAIMMIAPWWIIIVLLIRRREYLADTIALKTAADAHAYVRILAAAADTPAGLFHPTRSQRMRAMIDSSPMLRTNPLVLATHCGVLLMIAQAVIALVPLLIILAFWPARAALLEVLKGWRRKRPAVVQFIDATPEVDQATMFFSELLRQGANRWNEWRRTAPAVCPRLVRARLAGVVARGADLSHTNLTGADLSRAVLAGADIKGALFAEADLTGADLSAVSGAELADFSNARLVATKGIDLSSFARGWRFHAALMLVALVSTAAALTVTDVQLLLSRMSQVTRVGFLVVLAAIVILQIAAGRATLHRVRQPIVRGPDNRAARLAASWEWATLVLSTVGALIVGARLLLYQSAVITATAVVLCWASLIVVWLAANAANRKAMRPAIRATHWLGAIVVLALLCNVGWGGARGFRDDMSFSESDKNRHESSLLLLDNLSKHRNREMDARYWVPAVLTQMDLRPFVQAIDARQQHHVRARGLHLRKARFGWFTCTDCDFRDADLTDAEFLNCTFEATRFDRARMQDTEWSESKFRNVRFDGSRIAGVRMFGCRFDDVSFNAVSGVRDEIWDIRPSFEKSTFVRTTFRGADLRGFIFRATVLRGCDFRGARLGVRPDGQYVTQFDWADLSSATFAGTSLGESDLTGAMLDGTDFRGCDLTKVTGLTVQQIRSAVTDDHTHLPVMEN